MQTTREKPRLRRGGSDPPSSPKRSWSAKQTLVKVPEITAIFWLIKILTTGMGESASDFLAQWSLALSAVVGGVALAGALWRQFRAPRYHPPTYWFTVAMVAVFGTVFADVFNPQAGGWIDVSLPKIAGGYAIALAVCFAAWYRSEGTLSIHSITTPRREGFYWATVLLTFALGTAVGDWAAFYLNLGFATSMAYFAVAIAIPYLLYRFARLNGVAAFWLAYILTRPLGASVADWLGKDKPLGLGVGDGRVTLIAAALVVSLVAYLWRTGADARRSDEAIEARERVLV